MSGKLFTAHIANNEDSINAFTRTQFKLFGGKKRASMLITAVVLVFIGAVGFLGQTAGAACVLLGCLLFVDLGYVPKRTAKKMLENKKIISTVEYTFFETAFVVTVNGQCNTVDYNIILRLVSDRQYYYLFTSPQQCYMINARSLSPAKVNEFKTLLSEHSGIKWGTVGSIFGSTLGSLVSSIKNRNAK